MSSESDGARPDGGQREDAGRERPAAVSDAARPQEAPAKLGAFPFVLFFLALAAAAAWFAPEDWRWPAIGSALFVAIIIAMRSVSVAIGKAVEKKFNGDE